MYQLISDKTKFKHTLIILDSAPENKSAYLNGLSEI